MTAEGLASPTALRWLILGEWRAHPARALAGAIAIAVGVALGLAVHLINASALNEFAQAVRTVSGDADLQVRGRTPAGFDEQLYPRLARLPGVAGVSPALEMDASLGPRAPATLIGLDVLRAAQVTPALLGEASAGPAAFDPEAVFLSPAALQAAGLAVGDTLEVAANGRTARLRIAGTLPSAPEGQRLAVMDIAAAQWRFGRLGALDRLDLRLDQGADAGEARRRISALLPAQAELGDPQTEARRSDALSRAYRVNLDMLALVALVTGGFLVFSAQSLAVARRRPQFALARVLGLTRRAVLVQVAAEGAVIGMAGALAGLALGVGLAWAGLALLGGDLGGGYFEGPPPQLVFAPGAALVFVGLGLAAALLGSLLPARQAARVQAAQALKNVGDAIDPRAPPGGRIALALLAAGALAAFAPAVGGLPLFGYASIALLLAGGVAAMPWLARVLLSPLQRIGTRRAPLDLALKRLWGAPSQAAIALCGIVASTSLMIAMAVMVTSFRGSVDEWLGQVLPADLYLRLEDGGGFSPEAQAAIAAAPGVARADFSYSTSFSVSPDRPPVILTAREDPARTLPLIGAERPAPDGLTPVWASEPAVRVLGWRPGRTLELPIGAGPPAKVYVAGVWRDYARQSGALAMDVRDFTRLTGEARRTEAAVELASGAQAEAAIAAIRGAVPPGVGQRMMLAQAGELRRLALSIFDRSFAVTYLLEAIAILVGLAGVAATISAQTLARTKEFGMLRHLGVLKREIAAMLAAEGALLGLVGGIAGIGLGLAMSQVLIGVINPQSFNWTMQTRLPLGLFATVAVALVAASAGTALLAGRRALSAEAVQAVREDW
ncbi:FtsX-like permease family protein [Phenylobacterium terrae]|uniref:FtsX-like permease family protein n=1 Tax=Phenylobacterium terrae TaxID=2665495 RepID=A0ABW4MX12_9CAUL